MMSSSISKVGDVVIITQVFPRDSTLPLQLRAASATDTTCDAIDATDATYATAAQQATPPPTELTALNKMDDVTATFLQECPLNLGVIQIFLGVLCVLFSLTSATSHLLVNNAPLCLAIAFVASGSVAAAAAGGRASVKQMWASLVSNVVSVVVSGLGVAYVSWLLCGLPSSVILCGDVFGDEEKSGCVKRLRLLDMVVNSLLVLVLVLLILQFCAAATVTVFSGKSIRRELRRHHWNGVEETSEQSPHSP